MTPSEFQRSLTSLPQSRTGLACLALGHWPLTTDQWPLAARHSPLPACFGFVFDSQARARTVQPQAATSFALIPDWLRLAHFAVPGTPLASARCSLQIHWPLTTGHWPLTTGHWPLFRVRLPRSQPAPIAAPFRFTGHWSLATGHYSRAPRPTPLATNRPAKISFVRLPDSALVRPKVRSAKD